jgi:NAD(P) transhydrogenase subunit alpha
MYWRDKCIMLAVGVALLGATLAVQAQDTDGAKAPVKAVAAPKAVTPPAETADKAEKPGLDRGTVLIASLTIFVLAVFIGFELITKVPPTLHTPLMSGSNAISGITVVGAILAAGSGYWGVAIIGMMAVALATVNVVGGFLVTHRMLAMFQKKR